ncbi:MAG: DUF6714 family protein [Planctomycetota bacterium]
MPELYPCHCCGYRTLDQPPGGTMQLCPVCGWEDIPDPRDPVKASWIGWPCLREAQREFADHGPSGHVLAEGLRRPLPEESRPDGWMTIDEQAEQSKQNVLDLIQTAFQHVGLHGGTSLLKTVELDSYGIDTAKDVYPKLDISQPHKRWQDIPHEHLSTIAGIGGMAFLDPKGFRFYLPAYISWWLADGEGSPSIAAGALIFNLTDPQLASERYNTLTPDQSAATAAFVKHVAQFGECDFDRRHAHQALDTSWREHLPA